MICVVMNLLRNCLYRRVLWEMLGLLTGLSDLCDTVVRLPYPEKTVYDVIKVLDTDHSLSGFVGYISCPKQDCKRNV